MAIRGARAAALGITGLLLTACTTLDGVGPAGTAEPVPHTPLPAANAVMTLTAAQNGVVFSPGAVTLHYGAGARTVQWVNSDPAAPHRVQAYSTGRRRVLFSVLLAPQGSGRRNTYTYHFTTPAPDTITVTDPGRRGAQDGSATVTVAP
jgi:hypothetical protein